MCEHVSYCCFENFISNFQLFFLENFYVIIYYYFNEFNKSINEIKNLLGKLEKEGQKGEKGNMIVDLGDKLIYIDSELNRSMLCRGCKGKKLDKLMNKLSNRLTNISYLTVEITSCFCSIFI